MLFLFPFSQTFIGVSTDETKELRKAVKHLLRGQREYLHEGYRLRKNFTILLNLVTAHGAFDLSDPCGTLYVGYLSHTSF